MRCPSIDFLLEGVALLCCIPSALAPLNPKTPNSILPRWIFFPLSLSLFLRRENFINSLPECLASAMSCMVQLVKIKFEGEKKQGKSNKKKRVKPRQTALGEEGATMAAFKISRMSASMIWCDASAPVALIRQGLPLGRMDVDSSESLARLGSAVLAGQRRAMGAIPSGEGPGLFLGHRWFCSAAVTGLLAGAWQVVGSTTRPPVGARLGQNSSLVSATLRSAPLSFCFFFIFRTLIFF